MKTEETTITPSMAKQMLEGNTRNRPLREHHMRTLSAQMAADRWVLNGVPVIFNGKLLVDGQHRLAACVHSNTPFRTLVVRDVDPNAFATIDTGKKRGGADTLATLGHKNYAALAAAAAIVHIYFNEDGTNSKTRFSVGKGNNQIMVDAMRDFKELPASVEYAIARNTKIVPVSILAACHYIFSRIDRGTANNFINRLGTGTDVRPGSPMEELRRRLTDNALSSKKESRGYLVSIIIKAWNFERTGRNVKRLRGWTGGNNEEFPTAI